VALSKPSKDAAVAKPELGTKRLCGNCGAKFYDLSKEPIVCPKCATVMVLAPAARSRPEPVRAPVKVEEPVPVVAEVPEPQEAAEFVSLEEADKETEGAKVPAAEGEGEEEVEIEETMDDATFLEETDDEDDDVTTIIGGDIENEEET
jgi:uncharacterized protein (TIGR02300 family)